MFILFKNFKILYCDDYENSSEALRCFGRQDAQQITPKIYFKIKIWILAVSVNIK